MLLRLILSLLLMEILLLLEVLLDLLLDLLGGLMSKEWGHAPVSGQKRDQVLRKWHDMMRVMQKLQWMLLHRRRGGRT